MDTRARRKFRSQEWFDNPNNPGMTALYVEAGEGRSDAVIGTAAARSAVR